MGLKDTFRALRRGQPDQPEDAAASDVPEPMAFSPRVDGLYDGGPIPDGGSSRLYLRFTHSRVSEPIGAASVAQARSALSTGGPVGEFTPSGRFTVQARFERPVIYTVLAQQDGGFTARRTDTTTGTSRDVDYVFVSDAPPS